MNEQIDPQDQMGPQMPINQPVYDESTDYSKIYKIALAVLGFFLIAALVATFIFYSKSAQTEDLIQQRIKDEVIKTQESDDAICEQEKKDDRENPWMEYIARNTYGAFKFTVPRGWSKYEHFDINANEPLQMYFNPGEVRYDAGVRRDHSALEVIVGKRLYTGELNDLKRTIENLIRKKITPKDKGTAIKISGFNGTRFVYYDQDLKMNVGVIILPFRDRVMFIKTSDYDKYQKYYEKFYKSFVITP